MKKIKDLFNLKDKVAVVTGSGGLLGKQHCTALAEAGATVIGVDMYENSQSGFIKGLGNNSSFYQVDITKQQELKELRKYILKEYGQLDILVNNAAINDTFERKSDIVEESMFENFSLNSWNASLNVNITGVFLCCQILGSEMSARKYGSIINVASTYGMVAPDQSLYVDASGKRHFYKTPAYPVTKAAVLSFTRFLAAYWGEKGVRVNSLTPGGVENFQSEFFVQNYSKKTPLKRMAKPYDYKGAVVFLASDASAYMTGANLVVDGGFTAW